MASVRLSHEQEDAGFAAAMAASTASIASDQSPEDELQRALRDSKTDDSVDPRRAHHLKS